MHRYLPLALLAALSWHSIADLKAAEKAASSNIFAELDASGDGQLEAGEIPESHQALFARLLRTSDSNGDGTLSREEFADGLRPQRPSKPLVTKVPSRLQGADELLLLLALMDADADGTVTPNEPPQYLQRFYDKLKERVGAEGDGVVLQQVSRAAPFLSQLALRTVERLEIDVRKGDWKLIKRLEKGPQRGEVLSDPERAIELFKRLDANRDGKVVYREIPDRFAERFDQLLLRADRNDDDAISKREFEQLGTRYRMFTQRRQRKRA